MHDKHYFRQILRKKRIHLDALYRKNATLKVNKQLKKLLKRHHTIAVYRAMGSELDLNIFIQEALKRRIKIVEPLIQKHCKRLLFIPWNTKKSCQKIYLQDCHLAIMPLIGIDKKGYRLGQGGGYYDVSLSYKKTSNHLKTIGVGFSCQYIDALPHENHDEPLQGFIDELSYKKFK